MAFATTEDVATRLGRDLTEAEEAMVELVLEGIGGLILAAVDQDQEWADALEEVPAAFKFVSIEKTLALGANPSQLASISEQLGSYQNAKTFRGGPGSDLYLTKEERRMVRGAAGSSAFQTVTLVSPYSGDTETSEIFDNDIPL